MCSSIFETGVTSAAVPVKKHPTKLESSFGKIFLSFTLIFLDLSASYEKLVRKKKAA